MDLTTSDFFVRASKMTAIIASTHTTDPSCSSKEKGLLQDECHSNATATDPAHQAGKLSNSIATNLPIHNDRLPLMENLTCAATGCGGNGRLLIW